VAIAFHLSLSILLLSLLRVRYLARKDARTGREISRSTNPSIRISLGKPPLVLIILQTRAKGAGRVYRVTKIPIDTVGMVDHASVLTRAPFRATDHLAATDAPNPVIETALGDAIALILSLPLHLHTIQIIDTMVTIDTTVTTKVTTIITVEILHLENPLEKETTQ